MLHLTKYFTKLYNLIIIVIIDFIPRNLPGSPCNPGKPMSPKRRKKEVFCCVERICHIILPVTTGHREDKKLI